MISINYVTTRFFNFFSTFRLYYSKFYLRLFYFEIPSEFKLLQIEFIAIQPVVNNSTSSSSGNTQSVNVKYAGKVYTPSNARRRRESLYVR